MPGSLVLLPEALVWVPLPLPGEIVTAAISRFKAGCPTRMQTSLPCGGNGSIPSRGRLGLDLGFRHSSPGGPGCRTSAEGMAIPCGVAKAGEREGQSEVGESLFSAVASWLRPDIIHLGLLQLKHSAELGVSFSISKFPNPEKPSEGQGKCSPEDDIVIVTWREVAKEAEEMGAGEWASCSTCEFIVFPLNTLYGPFELRIRESCTVDSKIQLV
ncbi:hypothetical protein HOY80DRAFT_1000706 [Tuber brumale]|nr:hypothetical protein HOY80DRAFT_1000706 [Tuber brumale]